MNLSRFVLASLLIPSTAFAETNPQARPQTPSIGIGAGVTLPSEPLSLNTASVRVRFNDRIAIEPIIGYSNATSEAEIETTDDTYTSEYSETGIVFDILLRYTATERGRVAAQGLVGLGYASLKTETNPDGKNNDIVTETTALNVAWGLGLECFFGPHWSVSADATNPLFIRASYLEEDEESDITSTGSGSGFSLALAPTIRFMVHMNF